MSSEIKTTYKGHEIRWSDNEDKWACVAIGFSHENLRKVRQRIDVLDRKARSKEAVQAYMIGTYGPGRTANGFHEVTIVEAEDTGISRHGDAIQLWWHHTSADGKKPGRMKNGLSDFALVNPATDMAIAAYIEADKVATAAIKARDEAYKAIPRMKAADVQALMNADAGEAE